MPGFLALVPWILGGLTAAIGVASYTAAKKAQRAAKRPNDDQRGVLVNKESNVEQIPVIYGTRRVGGVRVFVATEGKIADDGTFEGEWNEATGEYDEQLPTPTNEYLFVALVLCEGEVQAITDILIDDVPATDPKYSGLININVYKGSDNQTNTTDDLGAADILRTSSGEWTSDHRLRGVAYLGMRFKWDEEAFSGIPEVTALVTGKKVYDPRTATTAWSDNPALCIRDYLTNARYGKGIPTSAIDDVAIAAAANDCDESVTLYDGGGSGKLFTCNAVLDTSKSLFDNLNILLLGCRGFLPYSQGQYRLKIDGSSSSQFTFTNNEIIDGIVITGESKDEKLNRVSVKFPNPDANWQPDTAIWPPAGSTEETTFLAEDGGVLLQEDIDLDTITNYYQARDLARVLVLRSRNAITCSIKTTSEALQLEIADVISITHSTPGWIAKPFQVTQMQLNEDGTVSLNLLEYDSTIYTWEEGTEQTSYPDTNLPNPFTVAAVSNITITETTTLSSDGTVIPTGLIEWDASYDNLVNQYEIQYKLTSQADTEFKSLFTSVPKYEFYNAEVGTSVTIRIRAINSLNVKGAFTTATFTVNGDTTAPGIATSVTAAAGYRYNTVSWTNPSDKDFAKVEVYAGDTSGSGSATLIGEIAGDTFVEGGLSETQTRYYYLKTVDFSGNKSAFSAEASATTLDDPQNGATGTRSSSGYVYYDTATELPPTSPTLSGFNFVTGEFSTISSGWSTAVSVPAPEEGKSFWAVRYSVSEDTFGGTQTVEKSAVFEWQNFDGLVTFTNITQGIDDNVTSIDGGKISSNSLNVGKIESNTSKSYGNFQFEFGTNTSVAGFTGAGILRGAQPNAFGVAGLGNGDPCVAVAGQQSYNGADSYGAYFANSLFLGGTTHRSQAGICNNTRAGIFAAGSRQVELANSTYAVSTVGDVYVNGDITATGTITPFTGMHDGLVEESISPEIGDIMVDTEVVIRRDVSNTLCVMAISSQHNQAAIGIYSDTMPNTYVPSSARTPDQQGDVDTFEQISSERNIDRDPQYDNVFVGRKSVIVNSVGEGQINVCGEGGDISSGDLIVTSSMLGKGMKQGDDIIRSYTVAKAREGATFSAGEVKQIACIYLCG